MKQQPKQKTQQTTKLWLFSGGIVLFIAMVFGLVFALNIGQVQDMFGQGKGNGDGKKQVTKTSTGNGKWKGAFNWSKGKGGWPKKSTESAIVKHDIKIKNSDPNINNLTMKSGGKLSIDSGQTLTVNGTLDMTSGGTINAENGDLILGPKADVKGLNGSNFTGSYSVTDGSGNYIDSTVFHLNASYSGNAKLAIHGFQSSNCDFSVNYHEKDPMSSTSKTISSNKLKHVSPDEYYDITRSGCKNSAKVTLFWHQNSPTQFGNLSSTNEIMIAHYNGSAWNDVGGSAQGSLTGEGHVTSDKISNFSPFTFGSTNANSPLPVELLYFKAKPRNGGMASLEWATASETNNSHFKIQKSEDGRNFENIGRVKGHGTSTERHKYDFTDDNAKGETIYYRLKQVDHDGSHEYSDIKSVQFDGQSATELQIQKIGPNPFRNQFELEYSANSGTVQLTLMNRNGQIAYRETMNANEGINEFNFREGNALENGIYILSLQTQNQRVTKKIVKR